VRLLDPSCEGASSFGAVASSFGEGASSFADDAKPFGEGANSFANGAERVGAVSERTGAFATWVAAFWNLVCALSERVGLFTVGKRFDAGAGFDRHALSGRERPQLPAQNAVFAQRNGNASRGAIGGFHHPHQGRRGEVLAVY